MKTNIKINWMFLFDLFFIGLGISGHIIVSNFHYTVAWHEIVGFLAASVALFFGLVTAVARLRKYLSYRYYYLPNIGIFGIFMVHIAEIGTKFELGNNYQYWSTATGNVWTERILITIFALAILFSILNSMGMISQKDLD